MRASKARTGLARDVSLQEERWDYVVGQVTREPCVAEMVDDAFRDGIESPMETVAAMDPEEVRLIIMLAHLAMGEVRLRAALGHGPR